MHLQIKLVDKEKELAVAQLRSAEMLKEITASRAVAEKKKNEVQAVKVEVRIYSNRDLICLGCQCIIMLSFCRL